MRLLSLFGLNARIRRLRIAAAEGALAAEDRVQLLRMAWEDEKQRLKLMLLLGLAVLGLTTVTVALLSVAVVVNFWDTPHRVTAAWSVAGVWIVLWLAAIIGLLLTLRNASNSFVPARQEFERDWAWAQERFGLGKGPGEDEEAPHRVRRPVTREELLARMEIQRQRIATMQGGRETQPTPEAEAPPPNESAAAAALRIARAHPVAAGVVAAAAVVVIRPKRLLRWAAVIAPVLWRMR